MTGFSFAFGANERRELTKIKCDHGLLSRYNKK